MTSPEESGNGGEVRGQGSLEQLAREVGNVDGQDPGSAEVQALARHLVLSEKYSGSFPHPAMLKQFDSVVANGAERAFQLTEREQSHRHDCEQKLVDAEIRALKTQGFDRRLAIILSFAFLFTAMGASAFLVSKGYAVGAGLFGGASLLTAIGAIIAATRSSQGDKGK